MLNTTTYFSGKHQLKFGGDFSYIDHRRQSLPLHFGGRYIFAPLPAVPGVLPAPLSSIQAFALGLPAAYVQGFGNPDAPFGYSDLAVFAPTVSVIVTSATRANPGACRSRRHANTTSSQTPVSPLRE